MSDQRNGLGLVGGALCGALVYALLLLLVGYLLRC